MSIAAIITDVIEGSEPQLILGPISNSDGPGQPSLDVVNDPCPPLRGLIGTKIWGCSSTIMCKETKIGDRIGYTKVKLLESPK